MLDLGVDSSGIAGAPLEIVGPRAEHLWDALCRAYDLWDALCRAYEVLGFDRVLDGDEVLRDLVLARIIEPTSQTRPAEFELSAKPPAPREEYERYLGCRDDHPQEFRAPAAAPAPDRAAFTIPHRLYLLDDRTPRCQNPFGPS